MKMVIQIAKTYITIAIVYLTNLKQGKSAWTANNAINGGDDKSRECLRNITIIITHKNYHIREEYTQVTRWLIIQLNIIGYAVLLIRDCHFDLLNKRSRPFKQYKLVYAYAYKI